MDITCSEINTVDPFLNYMWSMLVLAFSSFAYRTAVCDGYRAVLLKPGWVKVNYRLVNCLNLLQYYDEAIEVCRIGLEQCKSDPDIEKLHSLYNKLRKWSVLCCWGRKKIKGWKFLYIPTALLTLSCKSAQLTALEYFVGYHGFQIVSNYFI